MVEGAATRKAHGNPASIGDLMNALNKLLHSSPASSIQPSGHAFVIRAIPDLFTGETVNVGVCVVLPDGSRLVKVIDAPGRLECFYGDAAHEVVQVAKHAEYCALKGLPPPGKNVMFDSIQAFYNVSPERALNGFFIDWVTAALSKSVSEPQHQPFTTEDARKAVLSLIKQMRSNMVLDTLVAETPNILINVADKPRLVSVPLQPAFGAGTVESADYGADTIRLHLLDRITDLAAVYDARKAQHLAMFILRPQRAVSEKQLRQIDNAIDKVLWKAPKHMRVEVESSVQRTAELVVEWGEEVIRRGPPNEGFNLAA